MRGWMKGLLLAACVCAAAAACGRAGGITAPDATGTRMDESAPPAQDPAGGAAQSDTSGGRWGGFIGSGG